MGRVLIVGAGVVGLSAGVRLLEAGHRVDVLARDLPAETTSAVAAAIWYPYLADPPERVGAWAARTRTVLESLAGAEGEDAGVRLVAGRELRRVAGEVPWWRDAVADLGRTDDVPRGYAEAWTTTVPVADMSLYLAWLRRRFESLGGTLTRAALPSLPPAPAGGVVVNASGMGARLLADDPSVGPVRGQVFRVLAPDVTGWTLDGEGPTYVVPRVHDVVVGGTEDAGDWSRDVREDTASDIWRRALAVEPRLAGARVLARRVGLRPRRPEVRLEREGDVVHCYGHGGAGVTLSWGCAEEVVALVEAGPGGA
ncbi:FAD-dependent oxidoreductase [Nocardioides sp. GY 10127]|uniref:FAD-dependent oxidoreductase n=1 Tax=Nocardioides sp. GY 10127 TaxID=2569762 RepID=UPI0010A946D1|nr:FAD-dependent oxidoreductase [Nocardioides sp. GY 10127]TIC84059.1 FAD-dependent oxidoreductase [Nocardioides sp. GY 10127]